MITVDDCNDKKGKTKSEQANEKNFRLSRKLLDVHVAETVIVLTHTQ